MLGVDRIGSMLSLSNRPSCPPMRLLLSLAALMRPHQWLKNAFVFAGLVFSESWRDGPLALKVLNAFAAFCCLSSTVYIVNDWHDRAADARHPVKRLRPLASGAVPPAAALALAAVLLMAGLWLAAGNPTLLLLLGLYALLNLAYSWRLKRVPVVDVSIIASGFMLRLLAGTLAVGITPSRWMLLAGLFMALFLGFSKRKAESFHDQAGQRAVLEHYPPALLDMFMAVTMTATLMTYGLFATSPEAQLQHGERLVYSVPIVIFALLRYAYQVHRGHGEDVSRDLLRDPWILLALAAWLGVFLWHRI
jgi:decaprenyl-phosphate phosphoribosyltransferase